MRKSNDEVERLRDEIAELKSRLKIAESWILVLMGGSPPYISKQAGLAYRNGLAGECLRAVLPAQFEVSSGDDTPERLMQAVLDRHKVKEEPRPKASCGLIGEALRCANLRDEIKQTKRKLQDARTPEAQTALQNTVTALESELADVDKLRREKMAEHEKSKEAA